MIPRRLLVIPVVIALMAAGGALVLNGFDHEEHANLFPRCASCHVGVEEPGEPMWPPVDDCTSCHDGTVEDTVTYEPRTALRLSNLKFDHAEHEVAVREVAADSVVTCEACHNEAGATERMAVVVAATDQCLACHEIEVDHYAAAPEDCSTCHLTLAQATGLTTATIAAFPSPASHESDTYAGPGHGEEAHPDGATYAVAASCATCHAQDFCLQCHVDAPEQETIQALERDARSLAIVAVLAAPASHQVMGYYRNHGDEAEKSPASCQPCHTQESCIDCHVTRPREVTAMHAAAPNRGVGALVEPRPETHGQDFSLIHADPASAAPETCATCHTRTQCLECHRPDPGAGDGGFHPAGYLSRHPASAYNQETQCADCHNTGQFCASCHLNAGVVATGPLLGRGFHDAKQAFVLGHGQSARQNLESCVSCHAERDCLICHSALGGRRFNPHGPNFDAERLRKKNPQMCTACHGFAIPGG